MFRFLTWNLVRTVARAKQLEHEERAHLRANRTSISSGRPSVDALQTPGYTDVDSDDEEAARERDPRAARAASLVDALLEGDELEDAGLFSDEDLTYDDSDIETQSPIRDDHDELAHVAKGNTGRN